MKVLLISFAVGLFVGVLYGVIRVKSPAPPIVALLGLLGMVLGETPVLDKRERHAVQREVSITGGR
jgi:XapX domain-containing protein